MKDVANNGSNDMESIEVDFAKVRICIYRQMIGEGKSMVLTTGVLEVRKEVSRALSYQSSQKMSGFAEE